jgi:hypothetical protein
MKELNGGQTENALLADYLLEDQAGFSLPVTNPIYTFQNFTMRITMYLI